MPRLVAPPVFPTVSALPAGIAGMHVMYMGSPWYFDGTTWMRVGGGSMTGRVTINVGTIPTPEFTATVTDANVTATAMVQAWVSGVTPTGKDADEVEMDVIDVWCKPRAGQLDIRLVGQTGFIADNFVVDYLIVKAS